MDAIQGEPVFETSEIISKLSSAQSPEGIETVIRFASTLEPNERFRLIVRIWASLPDGHWAAPSLGQLVEIERRIREYDNGCRADMPWEMLGQFITKAPTGDSGSFAPSQKIYSAPRRFDLFTIMIVTAAYAVLLSGMSALRFHPIASFYVAAFITIVGVAQAVLFGGRKPRLASAIAGAAAYFLGWVAFAIIEPTWTIGFMILPALLFSAIAGPPLGYLAGVLVGGVFLVADIFRQRYGKEIDDRAAADPSEIASRPSVHPLDDVPNTAP